ncbi:unnamed protein product [Phytophthora lilii]|uniref:Unnamed protein product n=1 Tax=Phytophthora lilii TaxID=2077276 RepID=A0A9W6X3E1_9STRA|nr:unnamed protein product [Phytophthora lilii]
MSPVADNEASNDCVGERHDIRVGDLVFRQIELLFNGRHDRWDGKPTEEGDEERQPRVVKSSHVRALKAEEPNFCGFVTLLRVGADVEGELARSIRLLWRYGSVVIAWYGLGLWSAVFGMLGIPRSKGGRGVSAIMVLRLEMGYPRSISVRGALDMIGCVASRRIVPKCLVEGFKEK